MKFSTKGKNADEKQIHKPKQKVDLSLPFPVLFIFQGKAEEKKNNTICLRVVPIDMGNQKLVSLTLVTKDTMQYVFIFIFRPYSGTALGKVNVDLLGPNCA